MPSFDVVCRVDLQEVDNAINQTLRDVGQRFDFRNVKTELVRDANTLKLHSADDYKVREIVKLGKDTKAKVQVSIQGDQLRVTAKKRDDLQGVMQLLRTHDLGI